MKAKAILAGRSQEGTKKGGAGGKAGGGGKPTAAAEGGQAPAPAPEAADMAGRILGFLGRQVPWDVAGPRSFLGGSGAEAGCRNFGPIWAF